MTKLLEVLLSAKQLRAKLDKTRVALRVAGHSKYLLKRRQRAGVAGAQLFAAQVLSNLQRIGQVRKEAFLLT